MATGEGALRGQGVAPSPLVGEGRGEGEGGPPAYGVTASPCPAPTRGGATFSEGKLVAWRRRRDQETRRLRGRSSLMVGNGG